MSAVMCRPARCSASTRSISGSSLCQFGVAGDLEVVDLAAHARAAYDRQELVERFEQRVPFAP
jgi:hypothetical protein